MSDAEHQILALFFSRNPYADFDPVSVHAVAWHCRRKDTTSSAKTSCPDGVQ